MPDTLTITDNRTGRTYELPVADGTIRAADLRKIKTADDDFGLMTYDPALMNTAAVKSRVTYIDGDRGILRYRGYPDRAAGGAELVPRNGLPAAARGTADRRRSSGPGRR